MTAARTTAKDPSGPSHGSFPEEEKEEGEILK
jgi:hypothetical protein